MKTLKILSATIAFLAVVAFSGSYGVEKSYESRAKLVQRVMPSQQAALFGDEGEKIGSPQLMIIDDPAAFLKEQTTEGVSQVDDKYLQDHNIYPLQLQSVRAVASYTQVASGATLFLGVAGFLWSRRAQLRAANSSGQS